MIFEHVQSLSGPVGRKSLIRESQGYGVREERSEKCASLAKAELEGGFPRWPLARLEGKVAGPR